MIDRLALIWVSMISKGECSLDSLLRASDTDRSRVLGRGLGGSFFENFNKRSSTQCWHQLCDEYLFILRLLPNHGGSARAILASMLRMKIKDDSVSDAFERALALQTADVLRQDGDIARRLEEVLSAVQMCRKDVQSLGEDINGAPRPVAERPSVTAEARAKALIDAFDIVQIFVDSPDLDSPHEAPTQALHLIQEQILTLLSQVGVRIIVVTPNESKADTAIVEVTTAEPPPERHPEYAGRVAKVLQCGFQSSSGVVRQPVVIAYKRTDRRGGS